MASQYTFRPFMWTSQRSLYQVHKPLRAVHEHSWPVYEILYIWKVMCKANMCLTKCLWSICDVFMKVREGAWTVHEGLWTYNKTLQQNTVVIMI